MVGMAVSRAEPDGAAPFQEHAATKTLPIGPTGAGMASLHAASGQRAPPDDSQTGPLHDEYGAAHSGTTTGGC
jgi:hypothetical protein